jgi:hypothetical protein
MHRISCHTLFDITRTGILNRARPGDDIDNVNEWYRQRNTQCNFDTILQVISLRSQPDITGYPKKLEINFKSNHMFGSDFNIDLIVPVWTFDFEIQHPSVFHDSIQELGYLYKDCQGVPMVKCDTHYYNLGTNLDVTNEKRNIYFVKY